MARSEYQYLTWTEDDWEEYAGARALVPLPLLEKLMGAAESLSEGRRPGKEARQHWDQVSEQARAIWDHATEQYGS